MLSGMATGIQEVVRRDVGSLLLYVPVVNPREFDVAISYLVRRLEENAAPENFMSGVFDIATNEDIFARERDRFLAALSDLDPDAPLPVPNRVQDRLAERQAGVPAEQGSLAERARRPFVSEADSDPALAANRQWARDIAAAIPASMRGVEAVSCRRAGPVLERGDRRPRRGEHQGGARLAGPGPRGACSRAASRRRCSRGAPG